MRQRADEDEAGTSGDEPSDAELVCRVQSGDRAAFDFIDARYRHVLGRFLARSARGLEHADEIAQQTLIRAYQMIDQLRSGERLLAWLHRIAYRLLISDTRKRRTVPFSTLESFDVVSQEIDVVSVSIAEESWDSIWQTAKESLSTEEYRVMWLRYREQIALDEIAARMNKNETAVRVQLHRARQKMVTALQATKEKELAKVAMKTR